MVIDYRIDIDPRTGEYRLWQSRAANNWRGYTSHLIFKGTEREVLAVAARKRKPVHNITNA